MTPSQPESAQPVERGDEAERLREALGRIEQRCATWENKDREALPEVVESIARLARAALSAPTPPEQPERYTAQELVNRASELCRMIDVASKGAMSWDTVRAGSDILAQQIATRERDAAADPAPDQREAEAERSREAEQRAALERIALLPCENKNDGECPDYWAIGQLKDACAPCLARAALSDTAEADDG